MLGGWIVYFIFYFLTENLISYDSCHLVHCALDDLIPFNEYFAIFYCSWYLLIVASLLYFLLYDVESFKKLQIFIICTQVIAMICYICYPTIQNLRPDEFTRSNVFTWLMGLIYQADTPTGVCPSLHVAYSMGIMSVWLKNKKLKPIGKFLIAALCIMISISTAFVKQHSCVDIICAVVMCFFIELFVFRKRYFGVNRKFLQKSN